VAIEYMYRLRGEYIWIDGSGGLRSKTKIVSLAETEDKSASLEKFFGIWNYDGSSTRQAHTENSEVHIRPVCILDDPFRPIIDTPTLHMKSFLVLCETFEDVECTKPHPTNTRAHCREIMELYGEKHDPMFGLEQEFFMIDCKTGMPLDWDDEVSAGPLNETEKDRFYCGIGAGRVSVRRVLDRIVESAVSIGLNITGMNYEVAPGQAELQICEKGIRGADGLILLRYLLMRGFEESGVRIDFGAKPVKGDWNGSGCHVNFSTADMRAENGYKNAIIPAMARLEREHSAHIECYGDDNSERLTGKHETSSAEKFSWGVAHRGSSVRIPTIVPIEGCGYFEDRRPSSSMDPYKVTARIVQTVCSDD